MNADVAFNAADPNLGVGTLTRAQVWGATKWLSAGNKD